MRALIQEELGTYTQSTVVPRMEKMQKSSIQKILKKVKSTQDVVASVAELEHQLDELRNEIAEKFDEQQVGSTPSTPHPTPNPHSPPSPHSPPQMRHDRLLKELETKMAESVREIAAKLKKATSSLAKKCKKLTTEVNKTVKEVEVLGERVTQVTTTKRKRKRREKKVDDATKPQGAKRVMHRPPTPMVPQHASSNVRSWWNANNVAAPQAFVGSDITPRQVSPTPTPHFISPVYASRNFIR